METEDEIGSNWLNRALLVAGRHEMRARAECNGAAPVPLRAHGGRPPLHVNADGPLCSPGSVI